MCGALRGAPRKKTVGQGVDVPQVGKAGHIRRNCHKGRSQGSVQSADGDSVRGGRPGARGRGKGRGRGYRGRGGRGGNQAAAGGGASAVASSAATLGGGGAAAGSSGSSAAGRIVYVGGAGNSVGSAGVDSSLPLGQAGPVSGGSSAGATAATAPSAYSATWSGGNADFLSSTPSAGAQPWRKVNVGSAQGPSADEIPVDQSAECLHADLSLPGSFGSFMARVFLDSGLALTSIGVGLLSRMSSRFGGAALQIPLENGPRVARTSNGSYRDCHP